MHMTQSETQWDAFELAARRAAVAKLNRIARELIICEQYNGLTEIEKEHILDVRLRLQRVAASCAGTTKGK